ncbi:MAG TPA: hypothetical protein VLC46_04150 [Thermoanaerobaculia bacterium]|jgi:hypothetical protein|nr:hypothetical protein [Thermoanaerobaculia bacterium]
MIRRLGAVALAFLFAACGSTPTIIRPFFSAQPSPLPLQPPQDNLFLWLEGSGIAGQPLMDVDADGNVTFWHDYRGGIRGAETRPAAGPLVFPGRRTSVTVTLPDHGTASRFALSCGDPANSAIRCSYVVLDTASTLTNSLDNTPYTILAIVRRTSSRGDNYFVMTSGTGCIGGLAGGTGCSSNSALHVGWSGERTLRLGQYDNDVVLDPSPPFTPEIVLIEASRDIEPKTIALLDGASTNEAAVLADRDHHLLMNSGLLSIGGTQWTFDPSPPDWRFVGDILAVLVYRKQLSNEERQVAESYLRWIYGPR